MLGLLMLTEKEKKELDKIINILEKEKDEINYQLLQALDIEDADELDELLQFIFKELETVYNNEYTPPIFVDEKIFEYKNGIYMITQLRFKSVITYSLKKHIGIIKNLNQIK